MRKASSTWTRRNKSTSLPRNATSIPGYTNSNKGATHRRQVGRIGSEVVAYSDAGHVPVETADGITERRIIGGTFVTLTFVTLRC